MGLSDPEANIIRSVVCVCVCVDRERNETKRQRTTDRHYPVLVWPITSLSKRVEGVFHGKHS